MGPSTAVSRAHGSIDCFALYRQYHLRPLIRSAIRNVRSGSILQSVPLVLILLLMYAGYCTVTYRGMLSVPLHELRFGLLLYFTVMFFVRRHQTRSATLFLCSTSLESATILKLQALANITPYVSLSGLILGLNAPSIMRQIAAPSEAIAYLANDAAFLALISSVLAASPIVSRMRGLRLRFAVSAPVTVLLAAEMMLCVWWPPANVIVAAANLILLVICWRFGFRLTNDLTVYAAIIECLSRSVRQRLLGFVTRAIPIELAVYLRVFALSFIRNWHHRVGVFHRGLYTDGLPSRTRFRTWPAIRW